MSIGGIKSNTNSIRMNMQQSTNVRQTVKTGFGDKLAQGLSATANVVGGAASMGAAALPGGQVVAAALNSAKSAIGTSSSALTAGSAGGASAAGVPAAGTSGNSPVPNVGGGSGGVNSTFDQSKKMFEMQAGFNMKFLQLQNKMQHESRSFQTISNVMKNRTDTAKNSIRNMT